MLPVINCCGGFYKGTHIRMVSQWEAPEKMEVTKMEIVTVLVVMSQF
jgi:hypothetical protein